MINSSLSPRERFDRLRSALRWSWKDIDAITGRKNARTNIAKRVPAWSMLAIHTHEVYEVLLRHHLIELVGLYLGDEFKATMLSGGEVDFIGVTSREEKFESVLLSFETGAFYLSSHSSRIYELAEQLKKIYPEQSEIVELSQEGYTLEVAIGLQSPLCLTK